MDVSFRIQTGGDGLWSTLTKPVQITRLYLNSYFMADEDCDEFGELHASFDVKTWDVQNDGLVYTDEAFLRGFNQELRYRNGSEVSYSEAGMQGNDHISFDVDSEFLHTELGQQLRYEYGRGNLD